MTNNICSNTLFNNDYINNLNNSIESIDVSYQNLTQLPNLTRFTNLKRLNCSHNRLTSLPKLNKNLEILNCSNNLLNCLQTVPKSIQFLQFSNNEIICDIFQPNNGNFSYTEINIKIKIFDNFKRLFWSIKLKKQFRFWLWVKVRQNKLEQKYSPENLQILLENNKTEQFNENDFDMLIDTW
jgi:hypothetical protein